MTFSFIYLWLYGHFYLCLVGLVFISVKLICFRQQELTFICVFMAILSVFFYNIGYKATKHVNYEEGENVRLELLVYSDTIYVDGDMVSFEGRNKHTKEHILARYKLTSETEKEQIEKINTTMEIQGMSLYTPVESKRNLNGFDYAHYLDINQQTGKFNFQTVDSVVIYHKNWKDILLQFRDMRKKIANYIDCHFLPMTASYMKSLLFGFREKGPDAFQEAWKRLGMMHIFSLSGMHIVFFLAFFKYVILRIGITKETYYYLELFYIVGLMLITGFGTGMIRAGLQTIIFRINKKRTWHFSRLDCWSLALFVNTLLNPFVLLTIGGQLSYYLTFMILYVYPIVSSLESNILSGVVFNCLLSLFSLPFIWYYFYEWNLFSFILNLVLGPVIFCLIMPLLLGCFLLSFICQQCRFVLLEKGLIYFQRSGMKLATIDWFHQSVGKISIVLVCFVCITHILLLIELERSSCKWTKKVMIYLVFTFAVSLKKYIDPSGMIAFIDVGQGDSIFIQLPFHRGNYLIDTGGTLGFHQEEEWRERKKSRPGADYTLIPFLKSRGVGQIDHLFITHAHEDHFGDLARLNEEIPIKSLHYTEGTEKQPNFLKALEQMKPETIQSPIYTDTLWQKDSVSFESLYPNHDGDGQNDDSLVLLTKIKGTNILLTGDLELEGERELLQTHPDKLDIDILKVGHHGSKTSSHIEFLEHLSPKTAVISCGKNNRYGHPSDETLENLNEVETEVYRTDINGMVYLKWYFFDKELREIHTIKT